MAFDSDLFWTWLGVGMILLCRLEVEYTSNMDTWILPIFGLIVLFSITASVVMNMIEWDQDQFIMS